LTNFAPLDREQLYSEKWPPQAFERATLGLHIDFSSNALRICKRWCFCKRFEKVLSEVLVQMERLAGSEGNNASIALAF